MGLVHKGENSEGLAIEGGRCLKTVIHITLRMYIHLDDPKTTETVTQSHGK